MKNMKDPETWETFTQQVLPLLDELEPECRKMASSRKLQPAIRDLRERAERSNQTIVGVLGNTGDGKSSTINALLDEEK
ncbi:tat pathway signal sequence [Colletotrichum higginsianum]|nr:tat pathway signal sequence [Colletotrichum higginsianum]